MKFFWIFFLMFFTFELFSIFIFMFCKYMVSISKIFSKIVSKSFRRWFFTFKCEISNKYFYFLNFIKFKIRICYLLFVICYLILWFFDTICLRIHIKHMNQCFSPFLISFLNSFMWMHFLMILCFFYIQIIFFSQKSYLT